MELKHWSWLIVCACILLNILGIRWLFLMLIAISFFIVGWVRSIHVKPFQLQQDTMQYIPMNLFFLWLSRILTVIYLKHRGEEQRLTSGPSEKSVINNDPLVKTNLLGLNLGKWSFEFEISFLTRCCTFCDYLFITVDPAHWLCLLCLRAPHFHNIFTETRYFWGIFIWFTLSFYFRFAVLPLFCIHQQSNGVSLIQSSYGLVTFMIW